MPARPFDAVGIGDAPAQHLVAAAQAEHLSAAAHDARRCRCPSPASRSAARSAMVAFEPGRMTRSASPGSGCAGPHAARARPPAPRRSGSRSSKLAMCGRIGTAILTARRACARRRARRAPSASSAGRRARLGENAARGRAPASRCARAIERHAVGEQRRIAAELVDEEAADHRRVVRRRAPPWCRRGWRSRRRGRCRRPAPPARRRRGRSPYWRCRRRAD